MSARVDQGPGKLIKPILYGLDGIPLDGIPLGGNPLGGEPSGSEPSGSNPRCHEGCFFIDAVVELRSVVNVWFFNVQTRLGPLLVRISLFESEMMRRGLKA